MLQKSAIDDFLKRELNNFEWLKKETSQALDQALAELDPKPDFATNNLWAHQKAALLLLNEFGRFLLHFDMGGGKSLTTLSYLRYLKQQHENLKAIIFVPYLTAISTWIDETAKFAPHLRCVPLMGTTTENMKALLEADGDLFVMAYPSAVAMLSTSTKGRNGKNQWKIEPKDVRDCFAKFSMLVMDEIHVSRNIHSLTYKMLRSISAQCQWAVGLTGTPFNKELLDLWSQFYLIDFGETLGPSLGFYREVFFNKKINYWGGFEYNFKKKLFSTLQAIIKNISISYGIDEMHDMPERQFIIKRLKANLSQAGYAENAINEIKKALATEAGTAKLEVVKSNYLRLRQLSSGFMTLRGEDDEKVQIAFDENPKLDALIELINEMPPDSKILVFHHFVYTNEMISNKLTELKIGHARIWSGQKKILEELRRFKNDPACKVLVLNDKIGSTSLNLQFASYICFYEQPDSAIDRQQAERRVWRPGQKNKVIVYDLFVNGTYDEAIWRANKEGENLLHRLLHEKK